MKIIVTGGCGFLGTNLCVTLASNGHKLLAIDDLSRHGSYLNLPIISSAGIAFRHCDVRSAVDVDCAFLEFKPDLVIHLAGQVAMTSSIENPLRDFQVNALGTINVLEAIRKISPSIPIVYSSTNKVYGDLEQYNYLENDTRYVCIDFPEGFCEDVPLCFHSPYGCSKGAADQYVLDYSRIYGINSVVFRHSSMYGSLQRATVDQGWIGWFCGRALDCCGSSDGIIDISGSGKQVRDALHVEDMMRLYIAAIDCIESASGQAFNIGGGTGNSLSLIELFEILKREVGSDWRTRRNPVRESDQKVFIADVSKASRYFGWYPTVAVEDGLRSTLNWLREQQ